MEANSAIGTRTLSILSGAIRKIAPHGKLTSKTIPDVELNAILEAAAIFQCRPAAMLFAVPSQPPFNTDTP